jgi:hypothetical protein
VRRFNQQEVLTVYTDHVAQGNRLGQTRRDRPDAAPAIEEAHPGAEMRQKERR